MYLPSAVCWTALHIITYFWQVLRRIVILFFEEQTTLLLKCYLLKLKHKLFYLFITRKVSATKKHNIFIIICDILLNLNVE